MNQSTSEKNGSMSVETTLKKRKTAESSLETGAFVANDEMKKDIEDEGKPVSSSSLSEEGWPARSKLVKAVSPLYSIYELDFRNLV